MVSVHELTISYRKLLFDELSFTIGAGDKVGLVGLNGSGKTTLFRILAGLEQPDSGKINSDNERIGYLPQEFELPDEMIGEFLEDLVDDPATEMYKVNKILNKLELEIDIYQDISKLSHGQKMKLYLAKVLIAEPTLLLLDEPTNHLDLPGILWVESFIKDFPGMCMVISHDRAFLNNVTNKIFEIDEKKMLEFSGNYDEYLLQKQVLIEKREIQYKVQERHRKRLEDRIERIRKFGSGKKQSKQLQAAKTRLEREVTRNEISQYREESIGSLTLEGSVHRTKKIAEVKDLSFSYGDEVILEDANFDMHGSEKVWLFGANGIGKSTLIKLLIGELSPDSGSADIGVNLKWEYFSQDQSHLDPDASLHDYFLDNTSIPIGPSYGVLEQFLFEKDVLSQRIGSLSPGQRARLSFAIFAQKELDFLILDEPTNHLDIRSKEIIEEAFRNYKGAMLLISHDRYFVENLGVDRTITIADHQISEVTD